MWEIGKTYEKPWGYEYIWAMHENYVGKEIYIKKGERLSLQFHKEKHETIYVKQGILHMQLGEEEIILKEREYVHVPANTIHRMFAVEDDCYVIEVSTPQLHDVVRLEDDYGRN